MNSVAAAARIVISVFLAAAPVSLCSSSDLPSPRDVMKRVEENQRAADEAVAFEMILTDKSADVRRRTVREFRRRERTGPESSLMVFDDPPDIRGSALLSKEREDGRDDQWLYLPAVGKIRRIADSGRSDYFLGTDLTFEDLSVEDIDRFSYAFASADTEWNNRPVHLIDAVAQDAASQSRSGYGLRRLWIDAERFVILKTEYYDLKKTLIKRMESDEVRAYSLSASKSMQAWRTDSLRVENFSRRHKTVIAVTRRSLSINFPADFFTPRTLQRGVSPGTF